MTYDRFTTISEQAPQFEALLFLARTFPTLPPACVTGHTFEGMGVGLRVETATEAEAWRTALCVPPADVALHRYSDYTTLEFRTAVRGVRVDVYGATPLAPGVAAVSPAEDAERRPAALLVQRHEVEDPAEPPLGGAQPTPTPTALERGRAEAAAWNTAHPVGTAVAAYPQTREDEPLITRTRSEAWPLGHGDLVVLVEGCSGGICLTHVDVLPAVTPPAEPTAARTDAKGGAA